MESLPRGVVGSSTTSDDASTSTSIDAATTATAASAPSAATAKAAAEDKGHMQHDQHDHGVGVGAGEPALFAATADNGSLFSAAAAAAAAATTTADTDIDATSSGHATGEDQEPIPPTDFATSPRSGGTGFVAPSSYLRPLAVTREREGPQRTGGQPFSASESGAKRPMHPLDREQREGLVSGLCSAAAEFAMLGEPHGCLHARKKERKHRLTAYAACN
jgi:hypothetical protein